MSSSNNRLKHTVPNGLTKQRKVKQLKYKVVTEAPKLPTYNAKSVPQ